MRHRVLTRSGCRRTRLVNLASLALLAALIAKNADAKPDPPPSTQAPQGDEKKLQATLMQLTGGDLNPEQWKVARQVAKEVPGFFEQVQRYLALAKANAKAARAKRPPKNTPVSGRLADLAGSLKDITLHIWPKGIFVLSKARGVETLSATWQEAQKGEPRYKVQWTELVRGAKGMYTRVRRWRPQQARRPLAHPAGAQ